MPKSSVRPLAKAIGLCAIGAALVLPSAASAGGGGGIGPGDDPTTTPTPTPPVVGSEAKLLPNGLAVAPADAPPEVVQAIEAANRIDEAGYCLGGGHRRWKSRCYDCSGTISYVLGPKGANILDAPLPSGSFGTWGERGRGAWMTVYYNGGHAFIEIAGLRLDTSQPDDGLEGPGWSDDVKAGMVNGPFRKAHYEGL